MKWISLGSTVLPEKGDNTNFNALLEVRHIVSYHLPWHHGAFMIDSHIAKFARQSP
ncbi:MAG: hypothetical protein WA996_19500 [Candidatus Promineifilaceae bacterium]